MSFLVYFGETFMVRFSVKSCKSYFSFATDRGLSQGRLLVFESQLAKGLPRLQKYHPLSEEAHFVLEVLVVNVELVLWQVLLVRVRVFAELLPEGELKVRIKLDLVSLSCYV
jgi:hypothetical protein